MIPAFAIKPIATAASSAEYPIAPQIGAAYLNVSPIIETFVFALVDAAARISAKCPESFALNPNAVNASVTMSEVVARSSPEAAARFITPSRPSIMSCVFHPAIAIYCIPCAASEALNFVFAPISRAFARRSSISFPVAPDIDDTFDISESKSAAVFTAAVPIPIIPVVSGISFFPALVNVSPTFPTFSAYSSNGARASSAFT